MLVSYPVGFPLLLLCLLLPQRARIREIMEEVKRQSHIAQHSMNLVDLQSVQRDSEYEETKLMVRARQGLEASKAFDRQRRMPAIAVGGLLFAAGLSCILSSMFFGASLIYGSIGFLFGLLPGITITALAVLPGDAWIIEKGMMFHACQGTIFGFLFLNRSAPIASSLFDGTCVDYTGASVPCWISAIHTVLYAFLAIHCYDIARRIAVNLCAKPYVGSQFELIWRLWARWLIGYTVSTTLFMVPYLFFPEGRVFLASFAAVLEILSIIGTGGLGHLANNKTLYTRLQFWLANFGTVIDAMAVSSLMSKGGQPLEQVMNQAKAKLRCVTLSSMNSTDFSLADGDDGLLSQEKYAKSVKCRPREIDLFIVHSWHDPPLAKWQALVACCEKFREEHSREPRLWVDVFCLDPGAAPEPQHYPVLLMASNQQVALMGPTFMSQPWCRMEIFMWVQTRVYLFVLNDYFECRVHDSMPRTRPFAGLLNPEVMQGELGSCRSKDVHSPRTMFWKSRRVSVR